MKPGELATRRRNLVATFDQRLTVQRAASTSENPYGEAVTDEWDNLATVACRFGQNRDLMQFRPERTVVTRDYQALVPLDTDVAETDRVADVRAIDGTLLEAGPLRISGVVVEATHITLTLERVR